jgi:hypothetical protein
MKHRTFRTHSQAVAGVIEALLMVALISTVIAIIQIQYIPQVMNQKEAEHMDLVSNQFSTLKSMIDVQGMTRSSAPISSMITLKSGGLPYFITAESAGVVSMNEKSAYKITLNPPPGSLPSGSIPLSSIQYAADNAYFVDQTYILEGGGIIVQQPDGAPVIRADPSISAENKSNTITLYFDLPYYIGIPGKNYTDSNNQQRNCFVRTNYSSNRTYTDNIPSGGYIRIYSAYANAWNQSLYNLLGIYALNGYIDINWVPAQPTDYIEIIPGIKNIDLRLNVIDVYVQIGQGWIV